MGTKQFDLTNRCNLRCEPCYNRKYLDKDRKELRSDFVIEKVNCGDVVFLGGGEITLYDWLDALLIKLYPLCSNVIVSTNAVIYRDIPDSKNLQVQLSLVSLDEENYRKITNSDVSLDSVLDNMKKYAQRYVSFINVPVYSKNVDEMACMAEFAKDNGLFIRFREAVGFSDAETEKKIRDNFLYIVTNITDEANVAFGRSGTEHIEYYSPFCGSAEPKASMHPFMVK